MQVLAPDAVKHIILYNMTQHGGMCNTLQAQYAVSGERRADFGSLLNRFVPNFQTVVNAETPSYRRSFDDGKPIWRCVL